MRHIRFDKARGNGIATDIAAAARVELEKWKKRVGERVTEEKLQQIEIKLFYIPLPSADGFRDSFLRAMGLKE